MKTGGSLTSVLLLLTRPKCRLVKDLLNDVLYAGGLRGAHPPGGAGGGGGRDLVVAPHRQGRVVVLPDASPVEGVEQSELGTCGILGFWGLGFGVFSSFTVAIRGLS